MAPEPADPDLCGCLTELVGELVKDPLNYAETLRPLSKETPTLAVLESVDPLQALVVFAPRRPQMPHTAFLWGRDGSCCERLLRRLDAVSTYWVSTARGQAVQV